MTNKLFYGLLVLFSFVISDSADAQSWEWARNSHGDDNNFVTDIATDVSGNTYVAGGFRSITVTFGTTTLRQSGSFYGDIFLVKYDPSGAVVWAKGFGGSLSDMASSVTTDADGNVYFAGGFYSQAISFGSYTFTNPSSNSDYFIAKLSPSGTVLWATATGDTSNQVSINSIAIGQGGSIYATGIYDNSLHIGSTVLTNSSTFGYLHDIFIVKYNAAGSFQWAKSIGGNKNENYPSIATDNIDNLYVSGNFESPTLTVAGATLTNGGLSNMFFTKYDSSGSALWARAPMVISSAQAHSICTDAGGNVCVAGSYTEPSLTFGAVTITNTGFNKSDAFLIKSDNAGNVLWGKSIGGPNTDEGNDVHTDNNGNVYIVGNYFDSVLFGTTTLYNFHQRAVFAAKYTATGSLVYAVGSKTSGYMEGRAITSDTAGNNMYMAGYFSGDSCSFDSVKLYSSLFSFNTEAFVAKYGGDLASVTEHAKIVGRLDVYPNPNTGQMTVQMNNGTFNKVVVYDHIGRAVYSAETELADKSKNIDLSGNANGIYFVVVSGADNYSTGTFELAR